MRVRKRMQGQAPRRTSGMNKYIKDSVITDGCRITSRNDVEEAERTVNIAIETDSTQE